MTNIPCIATIEVRRAELVADAGCWLHTLNKASKLMALVKLKCAESGEREIS